jgi:hypothetical protein
MKRIALGLIFVQPLQADTIAYTIHGDFVATPGGFPDPWGIGSGSGTASINFTLAPPPTSSSANPI